MDLKAVDDKEIWPSHVLWTCENQVKIIEKYLKMKKKFEPFASSFLIDAMEKINFEHIVTLAAAHENDILSKEQVSDRADFTVEQFWSNLKLLPF